MNKFIQELAQLAHKHVQDVQDEEDVQDVLDDETRASIFNAVFAELIVRECARRFEVYWNDAEAQRKYSPTEYIMSRLSSATDIADTTE